MYQSWPLCPCRLYIYCSPHFLLFLISFFFSLCFLLSCSFVLFLCFLVVAFMRAVFCASCLFPPVFLPHTRLTSIKKGLGVASILPVVFSDYGHPGTSRNTACLAETNRAKHGDKTRSARPTSTANPSTSPNDLFVVSSWQVSGCPGIFPRDSALRHENPPVQSPTAQKLDCGFGALLGGSMTASSREDAA